MLWGEFTCGRDGATTPAPVCLPGRQPIPSSAQGPLLSWPAEPSRHSSTLETETSSDWEPLAESEKPTSPGRSTTPRPVLGKALVRGLRDSQHLQWEVSFELGPPGPARGSGRDNDLWSETFHHLAARAIIRDFEQLAEREGEIEQGERPDPCHSRGSTQCPLTAWTVPTHTQLRTLAPPHSTLRACPLPTLQGESSFLLH